LIEINVGFVPQGLGLQGLVDIGAANHADILLEPHEIETARP
jgi:hypothetical protein